PRNAPALAEKSLSHCRWLRGPRGFRGVLPFFFPSRCWYKRLQFNDDVIAVPLAETTLEDFRKLLDDNLGADLDVGALKH
ncbi:MAG: hypothetical protein MK538_16305, partial [Planctomycetes bacterium]|nr:hypothetical protein [Planctomycetota bacterium]